MRLNKPMDSGEGSTDAYRARCTISSSNCYNFFLYYFYNFFSNCYNLI